MSAIRRNGVPNSDQATMTARFSRHDNILTNNVREWEELWRSKLPVDEIFELVVDSAWVGMRKPDPEIYKLTMSRLDGGLDPRECLFVDDNELNVEAARDLGMRAVHFESNAQAIPEIRSLLDLPDPD